MKHIVFVKMYYLCGHDRVRSCNFSILAQLDVLQVSSYQNLGKKCRNLEKSWQTFPVISLEFTF